MYVLLIEHDGLLKKHKDIWNEVSNIMVKNLNANPSAIKGFWRPKYGNESTDYHNKEIRKVGFYQICLVVTSTEIVLKRDENYYPQMF